MIKKLNKEINELEHQRRRTGTTGIELNKEIRLLARLSRARAAKAKAIRERSHD